MSVYLKDLKQIRIILFFTIIGSLILIGYSFFYSYKSSLYNINIIYNSGYNTYRLGNGYEYNFSVIGYNNTNNDLTYNLYAYPGINKEGIRYKDQEVVLFFKENEKIIKGPIVPLNINNGLFLGQFIIPKNTSDYYSNYEIIMALNSDILGDINNELDNYYNVDVKLFLIK